MPIAATNRNLAEEVRKGRFRADLYQRLSVYPVEVPPLRQRFDDISLLSGHFLEREKGSRAIMIDVGGMDVDDRGAAPMQAKEKAEITGTLAEMTASFQRRLIHS